MNSRTARNLVQDLDARRTPEERRMARKDAEYQLRATEISPEDTALALATLELDGSGAEA